MDCINKKITPIYYTVSKNKFLRTNRKKCFLNKTTSFECIGCFGLKLRKLFFLLFLNENKLRKEHLLHKSLREGHMFNEMKKAESPITEGIF